MAKEEPNETPQGVGGAGLQTLSDVYRAILNKELLTRLSRTQTFTVIRLILFLTAGVILSVVLIVAAVTIIVAYFAKPPGNKTTRLIYRGSVIADKQPVGGVTLSFDGRSDIGAQTSSERGNFTFELLTEAGKFEGTLRALHPAYDVAVRPVKLEADKTDEPLSLAPKALPEREWSGTVRDARGVALAGLTVSVEGTTATTKTKADGRFTLKAKTQQSANFVLLIERDGKAIYRDFHAPAPNIPIQLDITKE